LIVGTANRKGRAQPGLFSFVVKLAKRRTP
jgi:hypothetical protein